MAKTKAWKKTMQKSSLKTRLANFKQGFTSKKAQKLRFNKNPPLCIAQAPARSGRNYGSPNKHFCNDHIRSASSRGNGDKDNQPSSANSSYILPEFTLLLIQPLRIRVGIAQSSQSLIKPLNTYSQLFSHAAIQHRQLDHMLINRPRQLLNLQNTAISKLNRLTIPLHLLLQLIAFLAKSDLLNAPDGSPLQTC